MGTKVVTFTPCSPRRTWRPTARQALYVRTFSRGRMSDSGMPFAANPAKMAGQLLRLCPLTARDSASCWIASFDARTVDYLRCQWLKDAGKVVEGRAKIGPRWAARADR